MAQRDAFGRGVEEDPLAEMGWSTAQTSARTTPTETERSPRDRGRDVADLSGVSSGVPGPHQARGASLLVRALVVTIVLVVVLGLVAVLVVAALVDPSP